jgi:hypothetical protein
MRSIFSVLTFMLIASQARAQELRPAVKFVEHGTVQHRGTLALVLASDTHPLRQALEAVREEYGWVVDYEDPSFHSEHDFLDITNPEWRAVHPGERGQRILSGGAFHSEYAEPPNTATSVVEEEKVLNKIVADYNQSGNPGKFRVVREPGGRFAVIGAFVKDDVGRDEYVNPVLDTLISIPIETRSAKETVYLILDQLSAKTGIKFGYIEWGNTLLRSRPTLGGENVSARSLLLQAIASVNRPLILELSYNPFAGVEYDLQIRIASLAKTDSAGRRTTIPIDRLQYKLIYPQNAKPPGQ